MKRTRSFQFLRRLTQWRELYLDLRSMPILCLDYEISVEEAKRRFGYRAPEGSIGMTVGHTVYRPMEVELDPRACDEVSDAG